VPDSKSSEESKNGDSEDDVKNMDEKIDHYQGSSNEEVSPDVLTKNTAYESDVQTNAPAGV